MRLALLATLVLTAPALAQPQIAPTDALSPADEQKTFKLPPGFEVQLVAADPDIGKPIQIAFDARGRLWVTTSRHYPFPAGANDKPSDRLFVLSDFGADGKAKKVVTFADDLNIPIGILPLPDCNSCLVSHVGSILKLTDTNGDGKADKREELLTGFGTRDTHGMMNSFVLLPDGWVYACHGYLNDSTVKGKDGSTIKMQSGHTFRFRPDGTKLENWTFGQVNPFGMTVDPYLNLYTADCHSKPITQLIRGAHYDSFGKPHDGLGYAPHVTSHDHGSTALCGLAWYQADHFPKEWNGCMFLGNVITNRVNADRIEWKGGTPVAKELPDFLTSSDPWFRPTDIKMGPDGALYVADFYNKIIGHYEVDLRHPQRDKDRGRVWRIVWKGTPPTMPATDVTKAETPAIVSQLLSKNLTVRLAAANEIAVRLKRDPQANLNSEFASDPHELSTVFGLLTMAAEQAASPQVTTDHYSRILKDMKQTILEKPTEFTGLTIRAMIGRSWGAQERGVAIACLTDYPKAVHLHRAALDGMIANPHPEFVPPLVEFLKKLPAEDTHLRFAARVALRNALKDDDAWTKFDAADAAIVADVALGTPTQRAAAFLLADVRRTEANPQACEHIGRYGTNDQAAALLEAIRKQPNAVIGLQALVRGLQARRVALPTEATASAEQTCLAGLDSRNAAVLQAAIDLAGGLRYPALFDPVAKLAARPDRNEAQRGAAFAALVSIDAAKGTPILASALTDAAVPVGLRDRVAQTLGGLNQPAAREALVAALQTTPARVASSIAASLATSSAGVEALLTAVKAGKASAQLLQERPTVGRIVTIENGKYKARLDELTKGLPTADAKIAALIQLRSAGFAKAKPDVAKGKEVFTKNCAICHQIGGEGAKVGPNLDGIGTRGLERLLEDVLDPNRNVDVAFRATILNLGDGRTVTGLLVREEGQITVIVDDKGKEQRIDAKDIDKKVTSNLSAMPANVDTTVPEAEFYQLLAYLMEQKAKDPPK